MKKNPTDAKIRTMVLEAMTTCKDYVEWKEPFTNETESAINFLVLALTYFMTMEARKRNGYPPGQEVAG